MGFQPPENKLAEELAKYFQQRTEIEYDVLVQKMNEVPEADIMTLLGIKKKSDESNNGKQSDEEKSIEEISPEDEKEADEFLAQLQKEAKEQEEKEKQEQESAEQKRKTKTKGIGKTEESRKRNVSYITNKML